MRHLYIMYTLTTTIILIMIVMIRYAIHLIPKWLPFNYSFVSKQIGPNGLVQGQIYLLNFTFESEAIWANLHGNK